MMSFDNIGPAVKRGSQCVAAITVLASRAAAQGCAMCYQNAAAAGSNAQAGLRHGILILLLPTLALFGGIFAFLYHRRDGNS
jgi:hypothetical protein